MFSSSNWPFANSGKTARKVSRGKYSRQCRKPRVSAWTSGSLRPITPSLPGVLLSVSTVAERWDLSETKVYEMIHTGMLPVVSLGRGLLRVPEIALTYVAEKETELIPELF